MARHHNVKNKAQDYHFANFADDDSLYDRYDIEEGEDQSNADYACKKKNRYEVKQRIESLLEKKRLDRLIKTYEDEWN